MICGLSLLAGQRHVKLILSLGIFFFFFLLSDRCNIKRRTVCHFIQQLQISDCVMSAICHCAMRVSDAGRCLRDFFFFLIVCFSVFYSTISTWSHLTALFQCISRILVNSEHKPRLTHALFKTFSLAFRWRTGEMWAIITRYRFPIFLLITVLCFHFQGSAVPAVGFELDFVQTAPIIYCNKSCCADEN